MKIPFREIHLLKALEEYEASSLPLDLVLNFYFRNNKALGSKDRAEIAETLYALVRWKGLLDSTIQKNGGWPERLAVYKEFGIQALRQKGDLPPHVSVSFPKWLFDKFIHQWGEKKAIEIALVLNEQAPSAIRANLLKTTRDKLLEDLKPLYPVRPSPLSKAGILFEKRVNFFQIPSFLEGHFEVQDEGSQLIGELVQVKPGDHVLDYCSGSGGKTLAFAPAMQGKGQIYLHDVRKRALLEAKKRLNRAGIQNVQMIPSDDKRLKTMKGRMDWILVDAPCSGTGTLRRNPDMKWRLKGEDIERLVLEQREIFEKALSYLKPQGTIVYATCSLMNEENEEQSHFFEKQFNLKQVAPPLILLPTPNGPDGFYAAVFKRN